MIPILFDKNETAFTSNGLGRLTDCTRCEVTEERNGVYECEFDYPISGKMFSQIVEGRYIYATHDESKTPQPFEIYYKSAPLEGVVTFRAWHISYLLNNVIVAPFTASSVSAAMAAIPTRSITANPFTFWTDKAVTTNYTLGVPRAVRSVLGGAEGSLLDVYGKGDYEFDLWTVKLHQNRGSNRGVSIRYGKNLVSLNQERDASAMYAGIVPYWQDNEGGSVVYLDHAVYRTGASSGRVVTMDLSSDFEEQPTTAQLEARAQTIIDNSDSYEIKENVTVDFVALWQTEEYKDVANLQRIYLCDTVNIFYEKLGINATAKCIKVVYDSLRERYTSMELGTPKTTLAQQILETTSTTLLRDVPSKSAMQSAIDKATEMIAGGFGGYIKFNYLSDGTPSEMLIMNTADENTATNIIRLNQNGIGFSTDGGTTYTNAWTIDGNLNADFITTGAIDAAQVTVNNIDADNITVGTLQGIKVIADEGDIGGWTIEADGLSKEIESSNGYVYRVTLKPPAYDPQSPLNGHVLRVEKSQSQGHVGDTLTFDDVFTLHGNGSMTLGDLTLQTNGDLYSTSTSNLGHLIMRNAVYDATRYLEMGWDELSAWDDTFRQESDTDHYYQLLLNLQQLALSYKGIDTALLKGGGSSPTLALTAPDGSRKIQIFPYSISMAQKDENGTFRQRVSLGYSGLTFYDANGNITKTYSAT